MTLLIIGMVLWWVSHLFPIVAPGRRDVLAARLGEMAYKGVYAVATGVVVAVIVFGYQQAEFVNVWTPPAFLWHLNSLLMTIAVFLFIAGGIPSPVRRKIRHPQLAGVKTWAIAHLLVNGDLASVILFGGMLAWAVVAMIMTNKRDGARTGFPEVSRAGWPIHLLATIAVFWVVAMVHNWAGVSPFPG